ncbi:claudin-3-like isoform X2 [Acanthochromis polyacanthus]|uniref:claudin-3-like isoform X2 n=1 Tax=Acanthochromis polyacanthus TaxID=80966 RepID=UPI002234B89E|nr:claudin-3-like isoform X2 [Acanthochromis polyacanthus]
MPSLGLELLGVTLALLGWISAIVSCALPMWRVSAFIGVNIVTAQTTWEGIWMNCVVQSTGQMQCKIHDSMLALSADLQAARALTVISIVLGIMGLLVAIMGAKCTNCVDDEGAKARVMIAAGVAFIFASLTQLIPVSWSAHTIIMEFYSPLTPEAQKREIGAALLFRMSIGLELIGISLCILGWIIAIVACALPMWRVTAFIGSNIVTAQIIWEGLWMTCVVQSTGQMQCKVYDSMLALSQDLQAARALTVISILLAILAVLIAIAGAKCTNCIDDEASKAKVMIVSGVFFIVSGVMQLIPVSWSANTIIRDFYNPLLTDAQRRELGAALYIGWAAAALLVLGGGLLCCSCPPRETRYNASRMAYSAPRSAGGPGLERKDYV